MKITALAPWFGGKRSLAPRIVAELGNHRAYWEPFAGGFGVIFQKPPVAHETLNDLHGDIVNLARVVASDDLSPELFSRTMRTLVHEDVLATADAAVRGDAPADGAPNLDRAVAFFTSCWMGRNGEAGLAKSERGRTLALRNRPNGGAPGQRFAAAVDSIPEWWQRLRGVCITRRDAFELIPSIADEEGVVIYLDPPYIEKSDRYLHDFTAGGMFSECDHERLAGMLREKTRARVVVSYYDHPRVRELYKGWTFVDCAKHKAMVNIGVGDDGASEAESAVAPELLIVNGPSFTAGKWAA
ncbi:MAG: DNA adenine methylase [Phycisphaerales bacterium]|nr:DNA adenine methylase [Phycisphaerales bacterium]